MSTNTHRRSRVALVALLIVPMWIATSGDPSVAARRASSQVRYLISAKQPRGSESTICIGDKVPISVRVNRALFSGNDSHQLEDIQGARVQADMPNDGVGKLNPITSYTGLGGSRPGEVPYTFEALKEGTTSITFTGKIDQVWWGMRVGLRGPARRDIVQTVLQLKVQACAYKVTVLSHFSAQKVSLVGSFEGGLKRDPDGTFTGTASLVWIPVIATAGQCSSRISLLPSEVKLVGVVEDDELTLDISYESTNLYNVGGCPAGVNGEAEVKPSPVTLTVSASGGGARQSQELVSASYYSMTGYALVVVARAAPQ